MSQASDLVKILAIKYYEQGKGTQCETAETFDIDRRTFQRWYYKYKETGDISRKSRSSKSYKIRKNHVKYALKIIKKYQSISIYNLWQLLQKEFTDFSITPQHLGVVVRDNNITRKRTSKRHYPETRYGKKIDLKVELQNFYKIVDKYPISKLICVDETSISAQMKPNYSRCELGKRCVMKTVNNSVFIKYSLVVAINSQGSLDGNYTKKVA